MHNSSSKELFSVAIIEAISARSGANWSNLKIDNQSIDITIHGDDFNTGGLENPAIDLQLKCSSKLKPDNSGMIKFRLKKKNYDDLRSRMVVHPKYLVLMLVPEEMSEWIEHVEHDHIKVRKSCYWLSIAGYPESSSSSKVTVSVPANQVFCESALMSMLTDASKRVL